MREDYSADGAAWEYFPHDHARSRAYRWGEDGLAGISDDHQTLCFALALWNEKDPILKERLFGLTSREGNHGEDVKESYFYLDNTPTHSHMKYLYRYPQEAFPYQKLLDENRRRDTRQPEYELDDTGIFAGDKYFDVCVEYAKASVNDILIRITAHNRGPEEKTLHVLPTLWFRNTWSWGIKGRSKPSLSGGPSGARGGFLASSHAELGTMYLSYENSPELLFTENETNHAKLDGGSNSSPYVKDGINDTIVGGSKDAVDPKCVGTKAALHYELKIKPGEAAVLRLRLADAKPNGNSFRDFQKIFNARQKEANAFYADLFPKSLSVEERAIERQALSGLLWNKQFYHYIVKDWLNGDPAGPTPPPERKKGRNSDWSHLYGEVVLSMPDKWEYPWFASWDLAFHCIPLALVDSEFAKQQLILLTREWYMHPNGQIPAYEWAFGDANPPVHAWAAYRVYQIEKKRTGRGDMLFLERVFQKLLLNFTWWVNREDFEGRNFFQGGFLGLDNISVFDRMQALPTGGHIDQSDATAWMGMYCLNLLTIALELAVKNPSYEDIASKFFEHFLSIAQAMNFRGEEEIAAWDEEDGFFYDVLHLPNSEGQPLKVRSLVGLIPLFAVTTLEPATIDALPGFKERMEWFIENRPDLCKNVACMQTPGVGQRRLLSIVNVERLRKVLAKMLDEKEFLGDFGVRSLSRFHKDSPFRLGVNGTEYCVDYEPAESGTRLFGGNSNWRGPIWFPVNYLIIESLQKFHYYFGDSVKVECPTGSGKRKNLWDVAADLSQRLIGVFVKDARGQKPCDGKETAPRDSQGKDLLRFYEYFHGDTGKGLGASHQTGWTGLVAKLIQQRGEYSVSPLTERNE